MSNVPKIEPIKGVKEYKSKQSKFDVVSKLPLRDIILGPSGAGKGILISNMILNIYPGCFDRIYIFSPSIDVDKTWVPVKHYIEKSLKINPDKERIYFDNYDAEALENIIKTQHKIAEHMKQQNHTTIFQILIVIDDFADDPSFSRHSKLLHSLYTRGRHTFCSTITSTQVFNCLHPIIRKNLTQLFVYRLRNYKDLEAVLEELSALADKKVLMQMYQLATAEPHSCWYINLIAKQLNNMFFIQFKQKMIVE